MTDAVVELREYESAIVSLTRTAAQGLAEAAGPALTVGVGPDTESWTLTASGRVGTIVTPDVQILIRPKIPLHNLFLMLDVGLPAESWRPESFGFTSDTDLLPAVAAFFARSATEALARGPRRDYRSEEDSLVALRGRIDIAAQLRTPGRASPIACRFDEFTTDIAENVALKAAGRRLLRLPGVLPGVRRALERIVIELDDLRDERVEPDSIDRIPITRLNRHYQPALRLAQVVLASTSLLDRVGRVEAASFLVDMPDLFQRWVTARLRRALSGTLDVIAEPTVYLDTRHKVTMAPDLVFEQRGQVRYVGDIKYKLSSGLGRSGDYYQLLAYTTALVLSEGALIYCQTDSNPPDREVVVASTGTGLWTYRLPMAGTTDEVEHGLAALAAWLENRVSHTLTPTLGAITYSA